ncbi:PP2C family protein-serine/threonine phosphatase [Methanoculleus oceani]|uniref:PP2C family protein-serine/threonine phosphatase n=1 Tax=Methanoculleus oceani TaxID=2184756 RepID=UPI0020340873
MQVRRESGPRYAAMSDTGGRERNEDAYFTGRVNGYHVFAVADGLGGHACGEVASRMAVEILEETAGEELPATGPAEVLERAFERINAAIFDYNRENSLNAGTTLSAVIVGESGRCWIGTVGDSRTHIVTPSSVWHTRDQSYVQGLVASGVISPAEAMLHPRKNVLTQALGLAARVQVDLDEQELAGGVLVISSDGLHDYVPESVIREIVTANDPDTACRRLIAAARDAASTDNTTVIVARA